MKQKEGIAWRCLLFLAQEIIMKLELSPRLRAVADWIPMNARLADIGTDHAYLPVSLLLEGRILTAIAADIRSGPLEHARRTAKEYGVTDRIRFCLCDGLTEIEANQCNVIAIAGMGGETIAHILEEAPWMRQEHLFILQPQSTQNVLRNFLVQHGYSIQKEQVVREGNRWYPILLVQAGTMKPLSAGQAWCGRAEDWIAQPERIDYIKWLLERTQTQLNGLKQARETDEKKQAEWKEIEEFLLDQVEQFERN